MYFHPSLPFRGQPGRVAARENAKPVERAEARLPILIDEEAEETSDGTLLVSRTRRYW